MTWVAGEPTDCGACTWSQVFPDEATADRMLAKHMERLHPDLVPIDEVCDRLWDDHGSERDAIIWAIEHVGSENAGRVNPNLVRQLIPPGTTPQLIGSVYNVLVRRGRLRRSDDEVPNTDRRGRNTNKNLPIYYLADQEAIA